MAVSKSKTLSPAANGEFLRPYEDRSHEVHIEEGSQLSAQLDLIPADGQPQ